MEQKVRLLATSRDLLIVRQVAAKLAVEVVLSRNPPREKFAEEFKEAASAIGSWMVEGFQPDRGSLILVETPDEGETEPIISD